MWRNNITRALSSQQVKRSTSKLSKVVSKNQFEVCNQDSTFSSCSNRNLEPPQVNQANVQVSHNLSCYEPVVRSKSFDTSRHFRVEKVLVRWQQMHKFASPVHVKDSEQPKYGDLKIEHLKKFSAKLGLLQPSKSSSFSPQPSQSLLNVQDLNQQAKYAISINNSPNQNLAKEVLRVKQLRNQNCRPIKSMESLVFQKSQSSLLLKRSKQKSSSNISPKSESSQIQIIKNQKIRSNKSTQSWILGTFSFEAQAIKINSTSYLSLPSDNSQSKSLSEID